MNPKKYRECDAIPLEHEELDDSPFARLTDPQPHHENQQKVMGADGHIAPGCYMTMSAGICE